jgi:Kdo2-lipid IVA lauroyltransferase/acyltransferase
MKSYLTYAIAQFVISVLRYLPRSAATWILDALAALAYKCDPVHRHIAKVNLRIAFPELTPVECDRIARKSFQCVGRNLLEISRLPLLTKSNVASLVEYDAASGLNNYEDARRRGSGILYLTGHFSAWELLPAAHALYGYPLGFVTRPLDNAYLERYLLRMRESTGNRVIYKKDSAKQVLRSLKSGGSVGILMDQNTGTFDGIFSEFFGLPATTITSAALFALRSNATVLPGYLTPMKNNRYRIKFLPPHDLIRTGDIDQDIRLNVRAFNKILEQIIREQPESWLWGHKRWKYQPPENPRDLYRLSPDELSSFLVNRQKNTSTMEK